MITQKCAVSLAANALFMLISFVALYICKLVSYYNYLGLILAAVFMLMGVGLILQAKSKKLFGIFAFILNSLAFGCAACSVFLYTGIFPKIWTAAVCLGGYTLIFYLFSLASKFGIVKKIPVLWIIILILILAAVGIVGIVFLPETGLFQLEMFSLMSFTVYISTTAYRARDIINHLFHISVASFVLAIIGIIVAVVIVTEGEALEGGTVLDAPVGSTKQGAKRYNPFDYRPDIVP